MKAFYILMVSMFFSAACQQQQVLIREAEQKNTSFLINHPAGILINSHRPFSAQTDPDLAFAEKILSSHHIPLLNPQITRLVFVKQNGDRVSLAMADLSGKYDILLFDGKSNPVPLQMADLEQAANTIFDPDNKDERLAQRINMEKKHYGIFTDTLVKKTKRKRFNFVKNRDKQIVVSDADVSIQNFMQRSFAGIQWVEQSVDNRNILKLNFENDLITYANTDRYFTSGLGFELQSARLSRLPVQKLMIPYRRKAFVTYTLSVVQDIYTPSDTRIKPLMNNDRPYASTLYFGFRKSISDRQCGLKITSQLDAGFIGPGSAGAYLQTLVHRTFPTNDLPLGWKTQIKSDLILNYSVLAQKAIIRNKNLNLLAGADAKAGTLYNTAGVGLELKAGRQYPIFGLDKNSPQPTIEYYFFAKTYVHAVAYNALLQGGLLNRENVYTLKSSEIKRVVGNAEAGFHIMYKGVGLEVAQYYLSPEFKSSMWHKWGRISLIVSL